MTRFYHSVNTRYNIHFNAEEAYKEALKSRYESQEENLSQMVYIFPDNSDTTSMQSPGGSFTTTIDKATKAIKIHSIKAKPKRDPKRRNDEKYQAWLQQQEYTPFMDKVWILLAKAEFQEANYLRAITTFMYISKIYSSNPDIVAECQLWIARAYTEMGWLYEAGNVLHKMELAGGVPDSQRALYSSVKANYLIRNDEFSASIPHLEYAIKKEKDKHQKLRMKYLLGQVYEKIGDEANAYKAFASVQGMNTPLHYAFNAKLQQIQLDKSKGDEKIISSLNKLTKNTRNKDYLDQIYAAIGDTYMQQQDTVKAIENYQKAVAESVRNGYDKAMAEVTLGDLYFAQREFILAQPCYSEALPQLKKSHPDYSRVALRSDVLDGLVVHVKTVKEQDSLLYLARLPEEERLTIINNKIEELKKEEEKKQQEEQRQQQLQERENRISSWADLEKATLFENRNPQNTPTAPPLGLGQQGAASSFYFYNDQAVNQGKVAFQRQWGNRILEDNWRRRNKVIAMDSETDDDQNQQGEPLTEGITENSSIPKTPEDANASATEDMYSVDYYLQQLPLTEEAVAQSQQLIENALFNMGLIYKNKLEDYTLAIDAFETDIQRFPNTPNLEEIYYQLFLMYLQSGNKNLTEIYRNKLVSEFPQGAYTPPLSESDYEWNFRHMPALVDSLYNSAYRAYIEADIETVRNDFETVKKKYPITDLMPKFAFLNALTYATTHDAQNLQANLKDLTGKYPDSDVTPYASEILSRINDGRVILSDGSPITEFDLNKVMAADSTMVGEDGTILTYSDNYDTEYMLLLMFKPKTIDRNELLYQVADYNFSNYVIQTFDLSFDTEPLNDILQIKGFKSFANIQSYIEKGFIQNGLFRQIDNSIFILPISVENYTKVFPSLGMDRYLSFFVEHFQDIMPQLIASWDTETRDTEDQPKTIIPIVAENKDNSAIVEDDKNQIVTEITKVDPQNENKEISKEQPKVVNDKEVNLEDVLSKDQVEKAGQINDAIEKVEDIVNNPVDGIKGLFNKYKNKQKLTKEEKAEFKAEEKLRKELLKQHKSREKAIADSIKKVEKIKADSLAKIEKAYQDSISTAKKAEEQRIKQEKEREKNALKAAEKAKEDARKQKENEREDKRREQKKRQQQLEKERKEKLKAQEKERKERERLQNERLKLREKERKEKEKAQEKARQEKEKQARGRRNN